MMYNTLAQLTMLGHEHPIMVQRLHSFMSLARGGVMVLPMLVLHQIHSVSLTSGGGLDLCPFLIFDPVCDLDDVDVDFHVFCLVGYLSSSCGCVRCIGGSLEDLVAVQFLL